MNGILKTCSCGRGFTLEAWKKLHYVGPWHVPADETGPAENLELRNCPCGSTIAIDLKEAS